MSISQPGFLWRQSFSLQEKYMLLCMDRDDHGCRHELLRIVKTIVKRERTSLGALQSYHVKSAFVHYITKNRHDWAGRNSLGKHFLGFLRELLSFVERGKLPVLWQPRVNLLEEMEPVVLQQMANRLKRILRSEAEMDHFLSRIRLVQGECTMAELASCTFKDYAMACIGFVLELLAKLAVLAVVILLCFFLVAICLVIEKEKKNIPA